MLKHRRAIPGKLKDRLMAANRHTCCICHEPRLPVEKHHINGYHQFPHFVNNIPVPDKGHVVPPEAPGIGLEIKPELFRNGDAIVETVAQV